jgi:hypothetical protein
MLICVKHLSPPPRKTPKIAFSLPSVSMSLGAPLHSKQHSREWNKFLAHSHFPTHLSMSHLSLHPNPNSLKCLQ